MQQLLQAGDMQAVHFQEQGLAARQCIKGQESCSSWKVTSHLFFPAWKLHSKWCLKKKFCCWKVIVTFRGRREELKCDTSLAQDMSFPIMKYSPSFVSLTLSVKAKMALVGWEWKQDYFLRSFIQFCLMQCEQQGFLTHSPCTEFT